MLEYGAKSRDILSDILGDAKVSLDKETIILGFSSVFVKQSDKVLRKIMELFAGIVSELDINGVPIVPHMFHPFGVSRFGTVVASTTVPMASPAMIAISRHVLTVRSAGMHRIPLQFHVFF